MFKQLANVRYVVLQQPIFIEAIEKRGKAKARKTSRNGRGLHNATNTNTL
jgi:hypothetical protein